MSGRAVLTLTLARTGGTKFGRRTVQTQPAPAGNHAILTGINAANRRCAHAHVRGGFFILEQTPFRAKVTLSHPLATRGLSRISSQPAQALLHRMEAEIRNWDQEVAGFNIGINIGRDVGQTVFHTHVHLIPRRPYDVPNPRGGVRGVIPAKQDYLSASRARYFEGEPSMSLIIES